jgi:hypothetical protein
MLVNEYKPEFYVRKVRKMREIWAMFISAGPSPFVMSRTDAQNGLTYIIFKIIK